MSKEYYSESYSGALFVNKLIKILLPVSRFQKLLTSEAQETLITFIHRFHEKSFLLFPTP
jgi:hypothetical protein